ncbi:MAG: HAD family hydrolase [Leptolyngbyaceae bacterium]|nr:HAD family hydrolase [Leptolyngbyaceae bacterium]
MADASLAVKGGEVVFRGVETVLFDKDGTLAHSLPFLYTLGRSRARYLDAQIPGVQDPLLMAFGLEGDQLNPQGLLAVGSRRDNEIAAAAYVAETGRGWIESLQIVTQTFAEVDATMGSKAEATTPCNGVEALVRSLSPSFHLGMLSSDITANVVAFAQRYDLADYFDWLVGVDRVDKGDQADCLQFLHDQGINPKTTLVIGDSAADVQLAQQIGAMGCIGVTWGWQQVYTIAGAGAIATTPTDIQIVET